MTKKTGSGILIGVLAAVAVFSVSVLVLKESGGDIPAASASVAASEDPGETIATIDPAIPSLAQKKNPKSGEEKWEAGVEIGEEVIDEIRDLSYVVHGVRMSKSVAPYQRSQFMESSRTAKVDAAGMITNEYTFVYVQTSLTNTGDKSVEVMLSGQRLYCPNTDDTLIISSEPYFLDRMVDRNDHDSYVMNLQPDEKIEYVVGFLAEDAWLTDYKGFACDVSTIHYWDNLGALYVRIPMEAIKRADDFYNQG